MNKLFFLFSVAFLGSLSALAQENNKQKTTSNTITKPKLVVGIVVDQMRWDYLFRYADRYTKDGFNRLLQEGFSCDNAMIPYTPTVTAAGHTCIYTGSVPAIHGIVGNDWYDKHTKSKMYCSQDNNDTIQSVGTSSKNGKQSPHNMLVTTIGDEIRLASNFQSKVIGIALKDRGSILPAGHSATAAFWYDITNGKWISSTYYAKSLPAWVNNFNALHVVDSFYKKGWNTLYPITTYNQSTSDVKPYESTPFGGEQKGFPYQLQQFVDKNYQPIAVTPFGNSMTLAMAKSAIENEKLGNGLATDMLCVSLSSTDYVGHNFGPNSIEAEDTYLRLDKELADFLQYLDKKIGKGTYTLFLSADHGAAHVPGFMAENKLPNGIFSENELKKELNSLLFSKFNVDKLITHVMNYQVYLNHELIDSIHAEEKGISEVVIQYLLNSNYVSQAFLLTNLSTTTLNSKMKDMIANGYFPMRSGDIQFILKPGYIDGGKTGTTHGVWSPYDAHIPMLYFGWGIKHGHSNREVYMTDIAPTITSLLHVQMPSGCVGKVVEEALK